MTDPNPTLTAHLYQHHCLPFPAGPVIPRHDCDKPSPWLAAVTSVQRATHAVVVLHAEFDDERDHRTRGTLARPLHLAAGEWQSRHNTIPLNGGEPMVALMRGLGRVVVPPDPLDQALDALARSVKGFKRRPMNDEPHKRHLDCFMAPAYRCRCTTPAPEPAPYPASPADLQTPSSLARTLGEPGGFWLLQSLLFVKLLHTHLAVRPRLIYHPKAFDGLYRPVLVLLTHLAQGDGPSAGSACALRRVMRRMAPYFCSSDAGDADTITPDFDGLPDWFDPRQPDLDGWAAHHAAASFSGDGRCGEAEAQALTAEVGALALEVASALTDPQIVPALPLTPHSLRKLSSSLLERRKEATERAKKNECIQPFDTPLLLSRMTRLAAHFEWVAAHPPAAPGPLPTPGAGTAPATLLQSTAVSTVPVQRNP